MAGTMNFFRAQDEARGRTTKLVVLLVLAIVVLAGSLYALAVLGQHKLSRRGEIDWFQGDLFFWTAGVALIVIVGGSLLRIAELSKGGGAIAERLGGRLVGATTKDAAERRYLNVVQEMALASGLPVPLCYVIDGDETINAFAAGNSPQDAAVGVTRGALRNLTRDELQGVIAHEFSHIGNGDMKLNLRIIGTVAGLTALAQLGYILVRIGLSSGSNRKNNAWPMAIAGLVVVLVGLGGVFFARVIQASVSRQREYLADASAVQFTRNPLGLASALRKVAGLSGAQREASSAELEAQHMFFAGSAGFLESLFSSHPPIGERIRRVDPAFDGHIPDVIPVAVTADDEPVAGLSGRAVATPPPLPTPTADPTRAVPTDLQIQDSVGFRGVIPGALREASEDPVSAMAVVLGLILRHDPTQRAAQLAQAEALAGGEVVKEARRLDALLRAVPAGSRVALLDLSMPALRQLSPAQVAAFRKALERAGYEAEDGLIVLLIQASMRRYLSTEKNPPSRPGDLASACGLVLSAVVQTSGEDPAAQARAYALGAGVLGMAGLSPTMVPPASVDLGKVDEALAVIAGQTVPARRQFVRAIGAAMLHDGRAEPAEIEIVRAVADSLGISFATGIIR
ncbi:MAG: M48 family metallopeptidase [Opitutales bacterium]|jgi:Zn-dependent protease with chaperone function|nr:M48 family metallopeptidase [Opitutales bacterium]